MNLWLFILIPAVLALASLLRRRWLLQLTAIVQFGLAVYAFRVAQLVVEYRTVDNLYFYLDSLSALFLLVIAVVAALVSLYGICYFRLEVEYAKLKPGRIAEYLFWYNLLIAALYLVTLTPNLGIVWVAIEATTVTSVLLVGFDRTKVSTEAAWKYLLICSVGIVFALMGIMILHFGALPVIGSGRDALDWHQLTALAPRLNPELLKLALIFILIGFGTKVGFAPMHTWLPDAYSQAPIPVSILSGVLSSCALYGVLRVAIIVRGCVGAGFVDQFFTFFGLASVAVAIPFILIQHDLKRLLGYSSIENMGVIAFGLGIGGKWAVVGSLLQVVNHAVAKAGLFMAAGQVVKRFRSKRLHRMRGLMRISPGLGTVFCAGLLAIFGFPPSAIFFSKATILYASLQQGRYFETLLFLLMLMAAFLGLFYYFSKVMFDPAPAKLDSVKEREDPRVLLIISIPLVMLALFGFYQPHAWRRLLLEAARIVGGAQ